MGSQASSDAIEMLRMVANVLLAHSLRYFRWESRLVLDEGLIDEQFCRRVRQLHRLPLLNLLLQGAEVPLHAVDSHCQAVLQQEVFGVFREDRRVLPVKCQVLADEHSEADRATQPEGFVVAVSEPDGNRQP